MVWNLKWKKTIHILSQFLTTLEKDFEKGFYSVEIVIP
jgi:hypothetical protein